MQYALKRWRTIHKKASTVAGTMLLAATITLTVVGGALAADGVSMSIKDAPLREVVMLLTQQSGANIVIADESKFEKKVTATLNNVPLDKALDYIVRGAGISYKKMDDGTYIIGGAIADEQAIPTADIAQALTPVDAAPVIQQRKIITTVVKLQNSKPSELLRVMGWHGENPVSNSDNEYGYQRHSSYGGPSSKSGGNLYMNTPAGKVYDMSQGMNLENNNNNGPVAPTIDPVSLNPGSGRTADQSTGSGQVPNYRSYGPSSTYSAGNPNQPRTSTTNQATSTNSNVLWPDGLVGEPVPFDLDNSIIVKGDEEAIAQFKNMVRMLDVPPKQVEIKAEFVEINTKDIKNFGIDWSLQRLNESFLTQFMPAGNVLFSFTAGNLTGNLAAELTRNVGRIVNAPIISTLNNQWADISITAEIPFFTSTTIVTDSVPVTSAITNAVQIDSGLSVLPRVNGDGTVTMILRPRVSDAGSFVTGPGGLKAPETRGQYLTTQRRVANGETIVVGGFIRKNDTNDISKIPILGDLPIVGGLFRTTSKTLDDSELLIFVTPRIIPETGGGTVGVGMNQ